RKGPPAKPPPPKAPPTKTPPPPPPPRRFGMKAAVWAGIAALALLVLAFGFVRVAPGERAFRLAGGESATPLAPGIHFQLLFAGRIVRLGSGPIAVKGEVPLRSSEGSSLAAS